MLFFLLIEAAAQTRLTEEREQHTVAVVAGAAAHTRLAEEQEQHTVAVLVAVAAVARQRPPPDSSANIPINAPRGKRGNQSRDHTPPLICMS